MFVLKNIYTTIFRVLTMFNTNNVCCIFINLIHSHLYFFITMEEKAKRLELAVRHLLGSGMIKSQKDIAQAMNANKVSVSSVLVLIFSFVIVKHS